MIASFFLSSALVPVLSVWWLGKGHRTGEERPHPSDWVERLRTRLSALLHRMAPMRGLLVGAYLVVTVGIVVSGRG